MYKVTETQKGAIGENLVAQDLILKSNGRLSPFKPVADDTGIDLLVYDKETGKAWPLQVKTRTKTLKGSPNITHFEVRKATFDASLDGAVLAVLFDPEKSDLVVKRAWLIPMREFSDVASQRATKHVIRPSKKMDSKDKFDSLVKSLCRPN